MILLEKSQRAYIPFLFIVRYPFFLYPQLQNVPPDLKTRKTSR